MPETHDSEVSKPILLETIVLELVRQGTCLWIPAETFERVDVKVLADKVAEGILRAFARMNLPGTKSTHTTKIIRFPATWWDAVKKRWFPKLGWRDESVAVEVAVYHVCPHLPMPATTRWQHLEFLKSNLER